MWSSVLTEALVSMLSMTSWTSNSDPKLDQEMLNVRRKCEALLDKIVARPSLEESESQKEKEDGDPNVDAPEYEVTAENFTVGFFHQTVYRVRVLLISQPVCSVVLSVYLCRLHHMYASFRFFSLVQHSSNVPCVTSWYYTCT